MHKHEGNMENTVTLSIAEWRTVHAALQMTALTIQEARDNGDTGTSDPAAFQALSRKVWSDGVVPR